MTYREVALALLEETREFYYNEDWSSKGNHALHKNDGKTQCMYKGDGGKHCAIGRLDPEYNWTESQTVTQCNHNCERAVELLVERGLEDSRLSVVGDRLCHDLSPRFTMKIISVYVVGPPMCKKPMVIYGAHHSPISPAYCPLWDQKDLRKVRPVVKKRRKKCMTLPSSS